MTRGQRPKGDESALIRQFYRDEVEPLEKSVLQTDPEKLEMHPVYLVLCKAYFECWRIIREAAETSIDGQVRIDEEVRLRLQELSPWVLFNRSASAESAHGTPLGGYLLGAGLDYATAHREIERARKAGRGRPAYRREATILALEMELDGKTYSEIADLLEERFPSTGYDDSAHGVDRVRKLIGTVRPLYEKYRRRN